MPSSSVFIEKVGLQISAKIKIYIPTRAELLCLVCYEIPCISTNKVALKTWYFLFAPSNEVHYRKERGRLNLRTMKILFTYLFIRQAWFNDFLFWCSNCHISQWDETISEGAYFYSYAPLFHKVSKHSFRLVNLLCLVGFDNVKKNKKIHRRIIGLETFLI